MSAQPRYCSLFGCGQPGVVYSVHRGSWLCGTHAAGNFIAGTTTDPLLTYPLAGRPEDLAELAALRARLAETERERDELRRWKETHSVSSTLRTRAEAAEVRVAELEAAVRMVVEQYDHHGDCLRYSNLVLLRAFLAPKSPPCATCGGSGAVPVAVYDGAGLTDTDCVPCPDCRKDGGK